MPLLGRKESPEEHLIRSLKGSDPSICCQAARMAGQQRMRDAVPALVELLYSYNSGVREDAARALGEIGDVRAVQHLGEAEYWEEYPAGARTLAVIEEATNKLLDNPSNSDYLAQLSNIKMYRIKDYFDSHNVSLDDDTFAEPPRPGRPNERAMRFFANFRKQSFAFQGAVGCIRIYEGKETLPGHSFATGWLYPQTMDAIEQRGGWPKDVVGSIHFEFGDLIRVPYLLVKPEPNWPHPSIVRRCYKDIGGSGIRFEER